MADVSTHATLPTNLLNYWELEETSGNRVDSAGSDDLTEGGTGGVGSLAMVQGNGADFEEGDGDYLISTGGLTTNITGDFSVSFWYKPETDRDSNWFWARDAGGSNRSFWCQDAGASGVIQFRWTSGGSSATLSTHNHTWSSVAGTTYHVVLTFDSSGPTSEVFIDNSSLGTITTGNSGIYDGTADFYLGRHSGAGTSLDGGLDEFGLWSKILTTDEISDLYNSGAGLPYSSGGAAFVPKVMMF